MIMENEEISGTNEMILPLSVAHYAAERRCFLVCISCVVKGFLPKLQACSDPIGIIVEEIVNVCTRLNSRVRLEADTRQNKELFICGFCNSVMVDAVTIACGHTFCQKCIYSHQYRTCIICNAHCLNNHYQPNVIVNKCIEMSHPNERRKREMKEIGNNFMSDDDFMKAIDSYTKGIDLDNFDHFLLGNRAKAFLSVENSYSALDDSDLATKINPFWTKGFYRKATALIQVRLYAEAASNYFICLRINPSVMEAKEGLIFSLRQLLQSTNDFLSIMEKRAMDYINLFNNDKLALLWKMANIDVASWFKSLSDEATEIQPRHSYSGVKRRASELLSATHSCAENPKKKRMHSVDDLLVDYKSQNAQRPVPKYESFFTMDDFECCLCFRLLHQPVTTPCGHSFCRQCLARCLDYNPECPLCKQSLVRYLEERREGVTEIMCRIMNRCWPEDVENRRKLFDEEMTKFARAGIDLQHEMPIFVCTLAYPFVPCQLHIFEPRYRLMIRRCMECQSPRFGMTVGVNGPQRFVNVGTILNIRDVQYLPDGRSFVDTIGSRRFRVRQRNMMDGYHTATIELIEDDALSSEKKEALTIVCQNFYSRLYSWYRTLGSHVIANYGPLPPMDLETLSSSDGPQWLWWLVAVLPQDISQQLNLIASSDFEMRLRLMMSLFANIVGPS